MWTKIKDEPQRFDISENPTEKPTENPDDNKPSEENPEFTKQDENKWTFKAKNAKYAELTFKGTKGGGIAGNINGTLWDTSQMAEDTVTVKVKLPENTTDFTIEKTFSGIWSVEKGDMTDMPSELLSIKLYYDDESPDSDTVWGDANCDGNIDIADVVAVASYVSDSQKNALSEKGITNADVHANGDGITANDALAIQQYLADIVSSLPV